MFPCDAEKSESGITIVELMISAALGLLVVSGLLTLWSRFEAQLKARDTDAEAKQDTTELLGTIKRSWDYRLQTATAGVPASGYSLRTNTNDPCGFNTPCPRIRLYIKRNLSGTDIVDEITIQNSCIQPTGSPVQSRLASLNFSSQMNTACFTCPAGQLPVVDMTGTILGTATTTLAAVNTRTPKNVRDMATLRLNGTLGAQVCFQQAAAGAPLSVDIRTMILEPDQTNLRLIQRTQVFPFNNFANVLLEQ
jgi:hypothetical protein